MRSDEIGEQRPAAGAEQPGEPTDPVVDVLDVDAAPLVDPLVTGEVERRVRVDVVDLVRFDRTHRYATSSASVRSSASSLSTAR